MIFRGEGRGATRRDYHLIKIQKHRLTGRSEKSDIGRVGMILYTHCIHIIIICTSVGRWEILIESSVFWPVYRCIYYIYIYIIVCIYTRKPRTIYINLVPRDDFLLFLFYIISERSSSSPGAAAVYRYRRGPRTEIWHIRFLVVFLIYCWLVVNSSSLVEKTPRSGLFNLNKILITTRNSFVPAAAAVINNYCGTGAR